ncbi:MAG: nucleotidyltransferase domain-containing protein [Lactobacillaceae bacterium]|jgi:predicted nucleotidyltransferase|nr:nucleotidyltransferase domain-containing protein [Lactobacillaceae bacterium]
MQRTVSKSGTALTVAITKELEKIGVKLGQKVNVDLRGDEIIIRPLTIDIDFIKNRLAPIFESFNVSDAWIFGSYVSNEQTDDSDVDLLISRGKGFVHGLETTEKLNQELTRAIGKPVDITYTESFDVLPEKSRFKKEVLKTRKKIFTDEQKRLTLSEYYAQLR